MIERRAIQDGTLKTSFTLTMSREPDQSAFSMDSGDEDDLRSLLLDFRLFMSAREDVFANGIFNLLEQRLMDDEFREVARGNRDAWRGAMAGSSGPVIVTNDKQYRAADCFDLRVNGDLFHIDKKKAAEYDVLPEAFQGMVHHSMIGLVIAGIKVLWPTRNLVVDALEKGLIARPNDR
jgi:hypothetical protein